MHISNQVILDKSLFKAVVRNDMKDILRLIDLGADVNYEFTIDALIHNRLIDDNAITTIKNAEITVDELIGRSRCRGVKNLYILNGLKIYDEEITAIKNNSCSKIIVLPIIINSIILSTESKLSPLQLAIMYGWKEAIIELIKKGANPNRTLDIQGITILELMCTAAVFRDKQCYVFDEGIIQLLFDHGADPNVQDISGKTSLYYLARSADFHIGEMVSAKTRVDNASDPGNVHDNRNIRRIEKFLINGANPNIKANYNCCTILYDIVQSDSYLEEQPNLTNLLLDHGCIYSTYEDVLKQPGIVSMMQEDYGRNYGFADAKKEVDEFNSKHKQHVEKNDCLIKAIKGKEKSKVSILLNKGTNPNIRDKNGLSALHLAVKLGDCTIIELLLNKGANPNIKSWKNGTTPLFNAVVSNRNDIADLLLNHSANPSVINTKGLSPLYFSITGNNEEMTKLLLKYKANPDISHQISILFNVLNGVKNDSDIKIIESTLKKIKDIAEFLKFKDIPVDYSLFYQSVDIAEKNDKKSTTKKVMELLDELTYPTSQIQDLNLHQHSSQSECSKTMGLS
ncbi:ankyrin repeat domain-containing protein [Wolbachia endosymbiont of Kerria lacca]|uniref:ankyrin repeat domain-containing protein n=1 Tax=Wolbachia endosymbiont of Kerria lacca TaxID=427705 RepID=UPI003F66C83B